RAPATTTPTWPWPPSAPTTTRGPPRTTARWPASSTSRAPGSRGPGTRPEFGGEGEERTHEALARPPAVVKGYSMRPAGIPASGAAGPQAPEQVPAAAGHDQQEPDDQGDRALVAPAAGARLGGGVRAAVLAAQRRRRSRQQHARRVGGGGRRLHHRRARGQLPG